jgi:predicted GH43/DUF377 family glycosyl hydrolase
VLQLPPRETVERIRSLETQVAELQAQASQRPAFRGITSERGASVVVPRGSLIDRIELPKAVHRDIDWLTQGRRGAVDAAFNPAIFLDSAGKRWMLYRVECVPWFRFSRVAICQLDYLFCPVPGINRLLDLPTPYDGYNAEDPRFVACSESHLYLSYNDGSRMWIACIEWESMKVEWSHRIEKVGGFTLAEKEKNWIFEVAVNPNSSLTLFCDYSLDPHVQLIGHADSAGIRLNELEEKQDHDLSDWRHGKIRGGTPWFSYGDAEYCMFHSSVQIAEGPHGPVRQYYGGVMRRTLEGITDFTSEPLLIGESCDVFNRPSQHQVVFPCGLIIQDDWAVVSYGVNDLDCGLKCWPMSQWKDMLVPVA